MFIRKDLEEAIKSQFKVEKFSYGGIVKNPFYDSHAFVFYTETGTIMIEIEPLDFYNVYKFRTEISSLYIFEGETYLKTNGVVTKFPGEAFDFTSELVLLELEKE